MDNMFYTVSVDDVEKMIREAVEYGFSPVLVINGEAYIVKDSKKKGGQK